MHAVIFGGSRGCGYFTAYYLLSAPDAAWTITLLLRNTSTIENNARLAPYIKDGRLQLVKGDATVEADVRRVLSGDKVDLVVSSIGGLPKATLRGFVLKGRPDLCSFGMITLVKVLASMPEPRPRIVGVTTMGTGNSHDYMPWLYRWVYPTFFHALLQDKEGLENVLLRAAAHLPSPKSTSAKIIAPDVFSTLPENILQEVIVLRLAALAGDDELPKDREVVRAHEQLKTRSVTRSAVGRWIAAECVPGKSEWVNKVPIVGF